MHHECDLGGVFAWIMDMGQPDGVGYLMGGPWVHQWGGFIKWVGSEMGGVMVC